MTRKSIGAISAASLLCLFLPTRDGAQSPASVTRLSAYFPAGDPQRGGKLAASCAPCHAAAAPPLGDPPVRAPKLRHQRMSAIFYALQDYKTGRRRDPVMRAIAEPLGDQEMRDLAVYLAGAPAPIPKAMLTRAHARAADLCAFCHGETGLGEMDGYPVLTGQELGYLEKALGDYRSGSRSDLTMMVIAREISPGEAHDLAAYYAVYAGLESIPAEAAAP